MSTLNISVGVNPNYSSQLFEFSNELFLIMLIECLRTNFWTNEYFSNISSRSILANSSKSSCFGSIKMTSFLSKRPFWNNPADWVVKLTAPIPKENTLWWLNLPCQQHLLNRYRPRHFLFHLEERQNSQLQIIYWSRVFLSICLPAKPAMDKSIRMQ